MSPKKNKLSLDPHLVRSASGKSSEPEPIAFADMLALNVKLPAYVLQQLRVNTATKKTTARYEVLRGLKRIGYDINEADLVGDMRRSKKTEK